MSEVGGRWALVVHGGAKTIEEPLREAHRRGCAAAARAGVAILRAGGAAVDAAEACVRALEDDPTFNAGFGSVLNADGEVETDAAIMDGATLELGGVGALQGVRNPVSVARLMLKERPTLLVAEGARRFAQSHGVALCDPSALIAPRQAALGGDTVGCVALDARGNLAAATSTGGLTGKAPGRIGDSPLPGCGLYARNGVGAVSTSGDGEALSRTLFAARVLEGLASEEPDAAVARALQEVAALGAEGGAIALAADGRIVWGHNSEDFAVAHASRDAPEPRPFTRLDETPHG